jgi:N-acetylglutamate synthase-like GNAT family acetyltransferase
VTITLRPATAADQPRIVQMIREAQINPMGLHWQNFVLAVDDEAGRVIGTGQIKPHGDGSRELASIYVEPAHQQRGIAHQIIQHLIAHSAGTLYLTCMSSMGTFYERFGFRAVTVDEMTPYFRRLMRVVRLVRIFVRGDETLLVMKRDGQAEVKAPSR